jgi:uncharacterized protein
LAVLERLLAAKTAGVGAVTCSLDLQRSSESIAVRADSWSWRGASYPYPGKCKDRTIYHWTGESFEPVARYATSLIKLVPTDWGPPTFEIDGIKMLPTLQVSPYSDAERKVQLIQPAGKVVLDTCGGLGYFAAWCLEKNAARIVSFEKNLDVIWLRSLNPWSPSSGGALQLTHDDVTTAIVALADESCDAALHDPPRFGIAGELYSQDFYDQLARVLKRRGRLFHYTGAPNKLGGGRDVPGEVAVRLRSAGFSVEKNGDGLLAVKRGSPQR